VSSGTSDDVPNPTPHGVRDLKGRLRYSGEPKTLDEMQAGIVQGATAPLGSRCDGSFSS
jgi:hypothetical protein